MGQTTYGSGYRLHSGGIINWSQCNKQVVYTIYMKDYAPDPGSVRPLHGMKVSIGDQLSARCPNCDGRIERDCASDPGAERPLHEKNVNNEDQLSAGCQNCDGRIERAPHGSMQLTVDRDHAGWEKER